LHTLSFSPKVVAKNPKNYDGGSKNPESIKIKLTVIDLKGVATACRAVKPQLAPEVV
jgi:hypothetical protein